jgi:hypothetical protein
MYAVAQYLQRIVCSGAAAPNEDEFARTTFNRYYYAAFHRTKQLAVKVDPQVELIGHKDLPEFLRRSFLNEIQRRLKRGRQTGILSDREQYQLSAQAKHAAHELARLLKAAYSTRVIADYVLSIGVQFRVGGYSLDGTDVKVAARWLNNAGNFCESLEKVWREINA